MAEKGVMKKRLLMLLSIIVAVGFVGFLLLRGDKLTADTLAHSDVLLTVNGEALYSNELTEAEEKYTDMSERELVEGLVLEMLVLQDAKKRNIQVTEKETQERIEQLKQENSEFYEMAVKQYKTEEKYKEALKNRMLYEKTKEEVLKDFTDFYWEDSRIREITLNYIEENEYDSSTENISHIMKTYKDNYFAFMKIMAFNKYNYDLAKQAVLKYNYTPLEEPFTVASDGLELLKQFTLTELDKNLVKELYGSLIDFDLKDYNGHYTLTKVCGIKQSTNYINYLTMQFSGQGTQKDIEVKFILDSGNRFGLTDGEKSISILENGLSGYYSNKEEAYYIIDEDINGIFIISSPNSSAKVLEDFAGKVINYTKIQF